MQSFLSNATFIGPASAPALISIIPTGFSGLSVNITVPDIGSVCVDEYQAIIDGGLTPNASLIQAVIETSVQSYTFDFTMETCREVLMDAFVTVVAITNGMKGVNVTKNMWIISTGSQSHHSHSLQLV